MYIQGLEHGTLSLVRVPCRLESLGTQSRDWTEVPAASVFVGVCVCVSGSPDLKPSFQTYDSKRLLFLRRALFQRHSRSQEMLPRVVPG